MRTASAIASALTPRAAARAGSGRTMISGRCSAALELTAPMPRRPRSWICNASAARCRALASSPASVICSFSPLLPPPTAIRAPGNCRNSVRIFASTPDCDSARSPRGRRSTVNVAERTSVVVLASMPWPELALPTAANTALTSGICLSSSDARRLATCVWAIVAPGASSRVTEVCAMSAAGRKPVGSSGIMANDEIRNSAVAATTRGRRRKHARTTAR